MNIMNRIVDLALTIIICYNPLKTIFYFTNTLLLGGGGDLKTVFFF